jgi:hypothetical protein
MGSFTGSDGFLQPNVQHVNQFFGKALQTQLDVPSVSFDDILKQSVLDVPIEQPPVIVKAESSDTLIEGVYDKVPAGKFWNTVKSDGKTAYQCPWPDCAKRTFVN